MGKRTATYGKEKAETKERYSVLKNGNEGFCSTCQQGVGKRSVHFFIEIKTNPTPFQKR